MKVFLSHAIDDKELIRQLKNNCAAQGIELLIAEHVVGINHTITQKIELMIRDSAAALFLLTKKGNDSKFVQQEIGYSKSLNKPALYIVEKGFQITGFAYGNDSIELDPSSPAIAIKQAVTRLARYFEKVAEEERKRAAGILVVGIIGMMLYANKS